MLPRQRLICLLAIINHVDCAENLLLLHGDVETNTGPDIAQFAKQLQSIAYDLKEINEGCLTTFLNK